MFWSKNARGSLLGLFLNSQICTSVCSNAGSIEGSPFPSSLFWNILQWAKPTVCPPKRVTMSSNVNPFAVKNGRASDTESDGDGRLTSAGSDKRPSFLPVGMLYHFPPASSTESLVASAKMSAHETVEGHSCSNHVFASSMISNPRAVRFGPAFFSDVLVLVGSISTEPSQP